MLSPRALAWCLGAVAGCAQAAAPSPITLDFEDVACARREASCELGDQYMARGYALRHTPAEDEPIGAGLVAVGKTWKANRKGSIALSLRSCETQISLMANDNALFDALAIDLADMNGDGHPEVVFTAVKGDGSELTQRLSLEGKAGWKRFRFPASFKGLIALRWAQGDCLQAQPHMFDNIEVQASATSRL